MATLTEQLDAMLQLKPNWDGYNADPTDPAAVALAREFLAFFERVGLAPTIRAYPTRVGGVQFEWEDARWERELEIDPDGTIGLLHVNRATGESREETFRPDGRSAVPPGLLPTLGAITASFAEAA